MPRLRPLDFARVGLLVGALSLSHVQSGLALCGVIWRTSAVSWDNPATQLIEEVASQAVPHVDPSRQLRDRLSVGLADPVELVPRDRPARSTSWLASASVTRAPPAV